MKLILSITPQHIWQKLYPSIETGAAESITEVTATPDKLTLVSVAQNINDESTLAVLKSAQEVVIFYQQAEYFIDNGISNGELLSVLIEQWREQIQTLLDLKKSNRRKIKLVNINQLLVQENSSDILSVIIGTKVNKIPPSADINSYHLLLAKQALEQVGLSKLNALVHASSEVVGGELSLVFDVQQLFNELNGNVISARNAEQGLHLVSKELIVANDQIDKLNDVIRDLTKKIDSANDDVNLVNKSKKTLVNAKEHELKQQQSAYKILLKENHVIQQKLAKSNELKKLNLSLSLTNEDNSKKIASLSKELLKEKRLIVQKNEKLHSFSQKIKTLKLDIDEKIAAQSDFTIIQKKLKREFKKIESENHDVKGMNAANIQKIIQLESELKAIKGSFAWKTSAPIRAISNAISKNDKEEQLLQQDLALLLTSQYFDLKWYVATYPDVAASDINPAEHYLRFGAQEGRSCSPIFDAAWYLNKYLDVAESGMNPLVHFIKYGEPEGRQASPKLLELDSKNSRVKS